MCKSAPKSEKATIILTRWGRRCYSVRIFLRKQSTEWCIILKNATVFFSLSPFPPQMWKEHLEDIFSDSFGGLSRQQNGTYQLQMWRCSDKQGDPLLFIPLKRTWGLNKYLCLIHSTASQSRSYLQIKMSIHVITSLIIGSFGQKTTIVLIRTRYSKNVITVFLMT